MLASATDWDGDPDALQGRDNLSVEAGVITDVNDYAQITSVHREEGACGDTQVLSSQGVVSQRIQIIEEALDAVR